MNLSGLPTGTVSSGRPESSTAPDRPDSDVDPDRRIAELKRENEALRAAVEQQRRENERIVERYERLLEQERNCGAPATDDRSRREPDDSSDAETGAAARVASFLGLYSSD